MLTTASPTLAISRSRVIAKAFVVTAALAMPFLFHLLPPITILGAPAGAVMLPMFYAPLVAAAWRLRLVTGIALALPLINLLLIGRPDPATAFILTFEVGLFLLVAWNRDKLRLPSWTTGAAAYLIAKAASFAALSVALLFGFQVIGAGPADFVVQSLSTGWPGIVLMMILSALVFNNSQEQDRDQDQDPEQVQDQPKHPGR